MATRPVLRDPNGPPPIPLVRQPNGGYLNAHGTKGNRSKTGRTRLITQKAVRIADTGMQTLEAIVDGTQKKVKVRDRLYAIKLAWDIGNSGKKIAVNEVKRRLGLQLEAIYATCDPETAETLVASLTQIWAD